jgi:hypothetical protein
MRAVKSSGVPRDRAPPCDGERQKQSVEAGVVEPLSCESPGGDDDPVLLVGCVSDLLHDSEPFSLSKPSMQHEDAAAAIPKLGRQELQMLAALGENERSAAHLECGGHVAHGHVVARVVPCEMVVQDLNVGGFAFWPDDSCFPYDDTMGERAWRRPFVDHEAHRPELHDSNRIMAVAPARCRGEAEDVARANGAEHPLERHRRRVVASSTMTWPYRPTRSSTTSRRIRLWKVATSSLPLSLRTPPPSRPTPSDPMSRKRASCAAH